MARRRSSAPARRVTSFTPPAFGHVPRRRSGQLRAPGAVRRAPAVRVRGALRRRSSRRSLRPRRSVHRLQPRRSLGRQPARGRREHAAVLRSRGRSGDGAGDGGVQRPSDRGRRGGRPGGPVQRLPGADPRQGPRRRLPAEQHLHLRHARRVGAGQHGPRRGLADHLRGQQLLGLVPGPSERAGDRARLPSAARGDDPLHRGPRAVERPPVLVLVSVRRRPAHPGASGCRRPRPDDRHPGQRQPARRDARLQRRHPGARRAEQLGLRRLDQLRSATPCSSGSVASRSRWPGPWARSRARRCTASAISRTPQQYIDASHPAGCRTLFSTHAGPDATGALHVPLGYTGETKAFGTDMAATDHPGAEDRRVPQLARPTRSGARAPTSASSYRTSCSCSAPRSACSPSAPATTRTARPPRRLPPTAPRRA